MGTDSMTTPENAQAIRKKAQLLVSQCATWHEVVEKSNRFTDELNKELKLDYAYNSEELGMLGFAAFVFLNRAWQEREKNA